MRRESVQSDANNGTVKAEVTMLFLRLKTSAPDGSSAIKAITRLVNVVSAVILALAGVWISVYLHANW